MKRDFSKILLNKVEDKVSRVNTNYRNGIHASVRLALNSEVFGYRKLICQSHVSFPNFKVINIKNYSRILWSHRRHTTGAFWWQFLPKHNFSLIYYNGIYGRVAKALPSFHTTRLDQGIFRSIRSRHFSLSQSICKPTRKTITSLNENKS
jgi:hypothetical protein